MTGWAAVNDCGCCCPGCSRAFAADGTAKRVASRTGIGRRGCRRYGRRCRESAGGGAAGVARWAAIGGSGGYRCRQGFETACAKQMVIRGTAIGGAGGSGLGCGGRSATCCSTPDIACRATVTGMNCRRFSGSRGPETGRTTTRVARRTTVACVDRRRASRGRALAASGAAAAVTRRATVGSVHRRCHVKHSGATVVAAVQRIT